MPNFDSGGPLKIALSAGEPAGIGPDLIVLLARRKFNAQLIVFADRDLLSQRAKLLGIPIKLIDYDPTQAALPAQAGQIYVQHFPLATSCQAGQLEIQNAAYVLQTLQAATTACLQGDCQALVTGPVHKAILDQTNLAGPAFTGHTEFLAHACQVNDTVMLFYSTVAKLALLTTHLPLRAVPAKITGSLLKNKIQLICRELPKYIPFTDPQIFVAGLNPHAGEDGSLGNEEIEILQPAIRELQAENFHIHGPYAADTLFTEKYLQQADLFISMYHDQLLPALKAISFGEIVNVTLGLPFLRTSVDHGTALNLAGTGQASENSLVLAVNTAIQMLRYNLSLS